jgi:hypothetical protein
MAAIVKTVLFIIIVFYYPLFQFAKIGIFSQIIQFFEKNRINIYVVKIMRKKKLDYSNSMFKTGLTGASGWA